MTALRNQGWEQVFATGLVEQTLNGQWFIFPRPTPDQPAAESEQRHEFTTATPGAVQLAVPRGFVGESGQVVTVRGHVSVAACAGAEPPIVHTEQTGPSGSGRLDHWDEHRLFSDDPYPANEHAAALDEFLKSPLRPARPLTAPDTLEEIDAVHDAINAFDALPIGETTFAFGTMHPLDCRMIGMSAVPIVTDAMRAWLRTTRARFALFPVVRRQRLTA